MSYDSKCYDLAQVFLDDEPGYASLPIDDRRRLADQIAQDIQSCIEDALQDARDNQRFISRREDDEQCAQDAYSDWIPADWQWRAAERIGWVRAGPKGCAWAEFFPPEKFSRLRKCHLVTSLKGTSDFRPPPHTKHPFYQPRRPKCTETKHKPRNQSKPRSTSA